MHSLRVNAHVTCAFSSLALLAIATLAGCASLDPARDQEAVRADLAGRIGLDAPSTASRDLDPATSEEVAAMLREKLTEEGAIRIALLHNRNVRANYERIGIGRADLVQAGLLRNPVFDIDARCLLSGGSDLEMGLAQPFLDIFYRPLRERIAGHEFAAVQAAVTHDLVHLCFAVRRAFVRLRSAQMLVQLQKSELLAAEAAHALMSELHGAGNVTDQALAVERAGETRARLDLAVAEQAALEAREPVNALLGLFGEDTGWSVGDSLVDDPLAAVDLAHVESRAVTSSLELRQQRALIDATAQHAGLTSLQTWFPDGQVGVAAIQEPGGDWGLGPRLALELPLLDRGSARQARLAAELRLQLHRHGQLATELRAAARLLRNRLTRLADRVHFLRTAHLPARKAVLHTTLQHYNAMQIGVFEVLRQKQLEVAADREYLTTLRAAHLARLDLLELLAGSLPKNALEPTWPELLGSNAATAGEGH